LSRNGAEERRTHQILVLHCFSRGCNGERHWRSLYGFGETRAFTLGKPPRAMWRAAMLLGRYCMRAP
jgi:hypothetical protein